jgi:putative salt-induced outer membrane protein YdiY
MDARVRRGGCAPALPLLCLLLLSAPAAAQPPADSQPPPAPRWSGSLAAGFTGYGGNQESQALAATLQLAWRAVLWEWDLGGAAHFVEIEKQDDERDPSRHQDEEVDTALRRVLTERTYALARGKWEHTPASGISSKLEAGLGAGLHLARGSAFAFRLEGGLSHTEEEQDGSRLGFPGAFLGSTLTRPFGRGAQLTWVNHLKVSLEESDDVESDQEVALSSALTRRLTLGLQAEWEYDGEPPPGFEKSDYKLLATLGLLFPAEPSSSSLPPAH